MSNKKQTAVEWLFEQYKFIGVLTTAQVEKAKEMHKKEIVKAYCNASPIEDGITIAVNKGNDYYCETYEDNNE